MRTSRLLLLAVLAGGLMLAAVAAWAGEADGSGAEYFSIIKTARTGDPQQAINELTDFVARNPEDSKADDALLEIGRLYEDELCDFERAASTYEELLDRYPTARSSRRARRALARLRTDRAGGDEPLCRYRGVLNHYADRGAAASIREMKAILERYPDFAKRDEAAYWIADQYFRQLREYQQAADAYEKVVDEFPGTKSAFHALKGLGDLYTEYLVDFDRAEAYYRRMAGFGDVFQFAEQAAQTNLERLREFRALRLAYRICVGVWIVGMAYLAATVRWKTVRSGLSLRANLDVVVYVWLAAVLALVLWKYTGGYAGTLVSLAVGTTAILVLGSLSIRERSLSGAGKAAHFFVMLLLIACAQYAVFYKYDLVNIVWDTILTNYQTLGFGG